MIFMIAVMFSLVSAVIRLKSRVPDGFLSFQGVSVEDNKLSRCSLLFPRLSNRRTLVEPCVPSAWLFCSQLL